eukprot:TRINITY_DN3157_c0_g1_i1.p1 TRINITY_DN3157_c0_g1~~TRINITY_DN3157_c0_g1_i1.p1  ORF type:complete len:544 (+),score=130.55 TRINITY_DN3157_c0_g1_i1:83-1714(+)
MGGEQGATQVMPQVDSAQPAVLQVPGEVEVAEVVEEKAVVVVDATAVAANGVVRVDSGDAALQITGDMVSVVAPAAVSTGFGIAHYFVQFGFNTARFFIGGAAAALDSTLLRGADTVVGAAQEITKQSMNLAQGITEVSLKGSSWMLKQFGAEQGGTLRIFFGEENAEALNTVSFCVGELYSSLKHLRMDQVLAATYALSSLQTLFEQEAFPDQKVNEAAVEDLKLHPCMVNAYRMLKFATAAYGWQFCKALNAIPLLEAVVTDRDCIKFLTGVAGNDIILEEWTAEPFRPGYFLCVDGETGSIILAFRGTANLHDALVDLACTPSDFLTGQAHAGFITSAAKLATKLKPLVQDVLAVHPGFKLVLTGHSLGAAMASMLATDWVEDFPDLQCYAFAAPCVSSLDVALLNSDKIFSFVHGNDLVSRWSLQSTRNLSKSLDMVHEFGSQEVLRLFGKARDAASSEEEKIFARGELLPLWENVMKKLDTSDHFFPMGELIYIDPVQPADKSRKMAHSDLGVIMLSPDALRVHLPDGMLKSFQALLA